MQKTFKNEILLNPVTKDKIAKDVDDSGNVTCFWNVVNAVVFALERAAVETVEQLNRTVGVIGRLKEQEKNETVTVANDDYAFFLPIVKKYQPFLIKGVTFGMLYQLLDEAKNID